MEFSKLQLNTYYNIETIAPNLLGGSYKNLRAKAFLSTSEVIKKNVDVYNLHNNIKQLSNSNIPVSADDCDYILFIDDKNTELIFAYQYLAEIQEVRTSNLIINIPNYTREDVVLIDQTLRKLGFSGFTIERT